MGKGGRSSCLPAIHSAFLLTQTTQPKDRVCRVLQSDLTFVGEENWRRLKKKKKNLTPPCSILNLLQCQRFLYQCCLVIWIYKESLPPFRCEEIISELENYQFQVLWDKSESKNRWSGLFPKNQITIYIIITSPSPVLSFMKTVGSLRVCLNFSLTKLGIWWFLWLWNI